MPDLKTILPLVGTLVGVIVGWFLKEISQMLQLRREDHRLIGCVLADLMEIRYRLLSVKKISDEVIERFKIPLQDQLLPKNLLDSILPGLEDMNKRYEKSVSAIASADPLLGFQLRYKALFAPYISQIRSIAAMNENSAIVWSQIETQLVELAKPEFDKLILKLSRLHGLGTWFYVRRHIRKPLEITHEQEFWEWCRARFQSSL